MKKILLPLSVLIITYALSLVSAIAEVRLTWESPGTITISGMEQGAICSLVQSPDLMFPFDSTNAVLVADSDGEATVMITPTNDFGFYKVTVSEAPPPPGMVRIPGGTNAGVDPDAGAYSFTVEDFYMDIYPVTKQLWDEVYNWAITNGYTFQNTGHGKGPDHPVQTIDWYDCILWCNARSEMEGRTPYYLLRGQVLKHHESYNYTRAGNGYRLPNWHEWEYAARGGLTGNRFPWGDTITHAHANYQSFSSEAFDISLTRGYHPDYNDGSKPYTSPVGSFPPNGYGLYDMCGNVFEWCETRYGSGRMYRGGSYQGRSTGATCAYRGSTIAGWETDTIGFRTTCR